MGRILGIDLGTTNSCMSFLKDDDTAEIIVNSQGKRTTPSIVSFSDEGELLVGDIAKNQVVLNAENTVRSAKRFMGENKKFDINGKKYSPQQISAFILEKMKSDAEDYLGEPISEAVITVPAYFSDAQRQATKDAGKIAGLDVKRIINEPTAAALAYGLDKEEDQTVLVYDLGGGTFDVSILEITTIEGNKTIEVRSTNGINDLGGDDFDKKIIDHIVSEFKTETGIDLSEDKMAMQTIKVEAEKAKKQLSETKSVKINAPFISANEKGPLHLDMELTRNNFENLITDLVEETINPINKALEDASLTEKEIDKILLVGGSTRIPLVEEILTDIFDNEITKGINPDEIVATGAAIQAGVLSEDIKGIVLVDVTPLTLGIETENGLVSTVIERNTVIPTTESKIYTTVTDNQDSVEIKIIQGEREFAKDNISLGKFELQNIRKAKAGEPRIEVEFDIDVDGILNISAHDLDTGKEKNITISNSYSLKDEEIEEMINEAKKFSEEDKLKRQEIESRERAESIVSRANRILRLKKGKMEKSKKEKIEKLVKDINVFLSDNGNIDVLKNKVDKLENEIS
ncbi:MAG: molecular chaperone DnaK [Fusobacteriota bacterium]